MEAKPSESDIAALLADLRSADDRRRQKTAESITNAQLQDDRIRQALQRLAEDDPIWFVRYAAGKALQPPAKPVEMLSTGNKALEFAIGFVSWWVVNVGVWLLLTRGALRVEGPDAVLSNGFFFIVNVLALLFLSRTRRYMALGVLATYGVNFIIAAGIGMSMNGICWYPFLVRLG